MLGDVVGDLLPSAVAIALSPVPIVAVVLVLRGDRAPTAGPAFAAGWLTGLAALTAIVVLVAGVGADRDGDDPGVAWLKAAVGAAFLVLAARKWTSRPKDGEAKDAPGWMRSIAGAGPARALGVGAALAAANPKNIALIATGAASIAEAGLDGGQEALAAAVLVGLGSASVVGLVALAAAGGRHAQRSLRSVHRAMTEHEAVISSVVLLLLGVKLLGDALAGG